MSATLHQRKSKKEDDVDSAPGELTPEGASWAQGGASAPAVSDVKVHKRRNTDDDIYEPFQEYEQYMPWIVLFISFCTRYYRIAEPPGVVFDEYHFGRFTNQYNAGTYLFDIHPPLGKLVLYYVGKVFAYDHTVCFYNNIQDAYKDECKYLVLRCTAAFFGTLTAPLMYLIARSWGGGLWAGLVCAAFFLFDNLNLTESRLVLIDSQLIFWCACALHVAQRWWKRLQDHEDACDSWQGYMGSACDVDAERTVLAEAQKEQSKSGSPPADLAAAAMAQGIPVSALSMPPHVQSRAKEDLGRMIGWKERNLWCVAMGVACSSAISIKWTGLATPGMVAVESFFGFFFMRKNPAPFPDLVKILIVAFCCYYTWFAIHFSLLPKTGDGDAFMRIEFQRTLEGNPNYDPLAPHPGYWTTFFQLNAEMLSANARIDVRHNWESVWWEWPLNLRGVLYYSKDQEHTYTKTVYLLGNPGVIWIILVLVLTCFGSSFFYLRYKGDRDMQLQRWFGKFFSAIGFCLWTYMLNLLPYIMVARSAFIYHYMPALMYGEIMSALMIEQLVGRKNMHYAAKVVLSIVVASWLFFAPWVYAFPLTNEGHARRRLYRRWD